jgi:hypothetical protein
LRQVFENVKYYKKTNSPYGTTFFNVGSDVGFSYVERLLRNQEMVSMKQKADSTWFGSNNAEQNCTLHIAQMHWYIAAVYKLHFSRHIEMVGVCVENREKLTFSAMFQNQF